MWSVTEEFCCAALYSESNVTTTAISKDFENWGLLALGFRTGYIDCYSLNWFYFLQYGKLFVEWKVLCKKKNQSFIMKM